MKDLWIPGGKTEFGEGETNGKEFGWHVCYGQRQRVRIRILFEEALDVHRK